MRKSPKSASTATPKQSGSRNRLLALEPRYLFDGVTLTDGPHERPQTDVPQDVAEIAARHLPLFDTQAAVDAAPAPATAREIMFVDPSVADYAALVAATRPGVQVVVLDASRDGVQQISDFLAGLKDVQAVYLVSHGAQGDLHLAASELTAASLPIQHN